MRRTMLGMAAIAERTARRQTARETLAVLLALATLALLLLLGVPGAEAHLAS